MSLETLTTISPTTNEPILTRSAASPDTIANLPARAQKAFASYRKSHPTLGSRQDIVAKALQLLAKRKDVLAKELTEQMGRPIAYTGIEIDTAVKRGEYLNRISGDVLDRDVLGEKETGMKRFIRREPVGVVLVIFAWNYPYLILVNSLIPALLAGNVVIIKPSPQTPTIVEHVAELFASADLPEDVIQYFHSGSATNVESLIRSPHVNHICFTGSVVAGLAVQKAAADRIVNIGLELGGNDPAYVRSDVDVSWAAEQIVDGAIFNSGQSCCAIERVYVHESIHDEFVKACQKVLSGYKVGDPIDSATQIGPVISTRAKESIQAQISDAIDKGAQDLTPTDNASFNSLPAKGNFIKPTLLTKVTSSMEIMKQETFGPVIPISAVADDAAAIKAMNDSDLGLTASIWTADIAKGEELASQVEAGTVFVNRADFPSPDLAWTGWKNSGRGVTLSKFGFEQFVKLRNFHIKEHPRA